MDDLVSSADKDQLSTVEMKPELLRMNSDMKVGFHGNNKDGCMKCFPSLPLPLPLPPPPPRFDFPYACGMCKDPLRQNMDIYMYRDTPFCSKACRRKAQIDIDEARERNRMLIDQEPSFKLSTYKCKFCYFIEKRVGFILPGREKEVLT